MHALLVLNRFSRFGKREGANVCDALKRAGIEFVRERNARPVDLVIAAGGDGTVISSVPLAIARGVPLGIVPLGTFNDLARTLGVPSSIDKACAVIAEANTRAIDVGRVNGVYFVNEASVGISTRIARRQTPEVKQRFGFLGIVSTVFASIRAVRPFHVELHFSNAPAEFFKTIQLTIANSSRFGGFIERSDAAVDDGWLDLYSVEPRSAAQAILIARKVLSHDPRSGEGLRTRRARRFDVRTRHAHHIAADGEPAGMTPAVFEIVPKAVRVIVPKAEACDTKTSDIQASSSR